MAKGFFKGFILFLFSSQAFSGNSGPDLGLNFLYTNVGPSNITTLEYSITNNTGSLLSDINFNHSLPTVPGAMTVASPSFAFTNCGGQDLILSAPAGGNNISLVDAELGVGQSCIVSVDVQASLAGIYETSIQVNSSAGVSNLDSATLTVDLNIPAFSKAFAETSLSVGDRTTLSFTLDNSQNPEQIYNLDFQDTLPLGLEIADPANTTHSNCIAGFYTGGSLIATPGTQLFDLSNSGIQAWAVDAGATCTMSVDVVATATGSLLNSSSPLSFIIAPYVQNAGKANASVTVQPETLQLQKAFLADPVPAGSVVDLEFTVQNFDRNNSISNIQFSDDLDTMLAGAAAINLPSNDVCGPGSQISGSSTISLSGGNLPPQSSCTFTVSVQVPGVVITGSYPNVTSQVTGVLAGTPITGNASTDSLFVSPAPILTKTFLDASTLQPNPVVTGGDDVIIEFSITNTSSTLIASDIAFTDLLTTYLPFPVSASLPAAGFCGPGSTMFLAVVDTDVHQLTVSGAELSPNASCDFSVTITLPPALADYNWVNTTSGITATVDGQSVTGTSATDTLHVVTAPRLRKEFLDDPILPGGSVTLAYTLTHSDVAPSNATGISFTDDLATVLTGLTGSILPLNDLCGPGNGSLTGSAGDTLLTFSGADLAPGESCTFTVTLNTIPATLSGSFISSTSTVSATVSGINATAVPAVDTLLITALSFSKRFSTNPVFPGEIATLEFTLDNTLSLQDVTGAVFTDNLSDMYPGIVTTGALPTEPCGPGSSITGTNFLIVTGANLLAGETCTFSVDVQVPPGTPTSVYPNRTSLLTAIINGDPTLLPLATDNLVVQDAYLDLSKSFVDDPVFPSDTVTLAFQLTNTHPSHPASNITFSDDLGAALPGLIANIELSDSCNFDVAGLTTDNITLSNGSLAAGSSCTTELQLTVPGSVSLGDVYTNVTSSVSAQINGFTATGNTASDDLLINYVGFDKAFSAPVAAGGTANMTFTIQNLSASTNLSNLSFSDDLNAMLVGATAIGLPLPDLCGAGSQISGTSTLVLTNGSLPPHSSCSFNVSVQIPAGASPGVYPNQTSALTDNGLALAQAASSDLTVVPPPAFSKSFSPNSDVAGLTSTLSFTIDNTGSILEASNLSFLDNLPSGMLVNTPAGASNTCGGTLTAVPGSGSISLSNGTVVGNAVCNLSVDVITTSSGVMINTTGDLSSSLGNSGTASDTYTALAPLPPGFSKAYSPGTIAAGETSTLTYTINNTSLLPANNLDFSDNLPPNLFVGSTASTTCTGGTLTATAGTSLISYTGGSVASGNQCTVQVSVTSDVGNVYNQSSGDLTSSLGNSGPAAASLTVTDASLPAFSKAFSPSSIAAGEVSTLSFTIINASLVDATALDFTDNLPAGLLVAATPNASHNCDSGTLTAVANSPVISFTAGSLSASSQCLLSVDVSSNLADTYINTTGDLTSSLGNSGTASDTLTVTAAPLPVFSLAFTPPQIEINQTSRLVLSIDNTASLIDATSLDFTINLPTGLSLATNPNSATSCTGGSFTDVAGSTTFAYTGGSVPASSSCTISVDVFATGTGDIDLSTGSLTSSLGDSGLAVGTLRVVAAATAIPTLTFWGLLILATLLLVGAYRARQETDFQAKT